MATGFSTQSELWPSACSVEEPSKPHSGSWSSVGNDANSLICVLPRRFGVGVYPSSQIYSSLYLVIEPLLSLMLISAETTELWRLEAPGSPHTCTRPRQAISYQAIKVPVAAVRHPVGWRLSTRRRAF